MWSRSFPAADDATLVAETQRSFGGARWRECDAVWVSGDGAAAAAMLDLGVPISDPPWTELRAAGIWPTSASRGARPSWPWRPPRVAASGRSTSSRRPSSRAVSRAQEKLTGAVLAVTVLLALTALLFPGFREGRRLARLNAEITRIDPEVKTVERAARELERKRQLLATLEKVGTGALQPLPMLRELTDIIPGDAWVTYLSFDAKGVELTGQAGAASTLIPLLENSPRLERVEFASPVTRGPRPRAVPDPRDAWEAPERRAAGPDREGAGRRARRHAAGDRACRPSRLRVSRLRPAGATRASGEAVGTGPAGRRPRQPCADDRQSLAPGADAGRAGRGRRRGAGRLAVRGRADPRAQSLGGRAGAGARAGAAAAARSDRAAGRDHRRARRHGEACSTSCRKASSPRARPPWPLELQKDREGYGRAGKDRGAQRAHPAAGRSRRAARDSRRDRRAPARSGSSSTCSRGSTARRSSLPVQELKIRVVEHDSQPKDLLVTLTVSGFVLPAAPGKARADAEPPARRQRGAPPASRCCASGSS